MFQQSYLYFLTQTIRSSATDPTCCHILEANAASECGSLLTTGLVRYKILYLNIIFLSS